MRVNVLLEGLNECCLTVELDYTPGQDGDHNAADAFRCGITTSGFILCHVTLSTTHSHKKVCLDSSLFI